MEKDLEIVSILKQIYKLKSAMSVIIGNNR